MAKPTPRDYVRDTALVVIVAVAYGVARPGYAHARARRTPRQWLGRIVAQSLIVTGLELWLKPLMQRSRRAQEELTAELGREPALDELMARMELLEASCATS